MNRLDKIADDLTLAQQDIPNGAPRADVSAWLMDRAARLTDTSEEPTT